MYTHIYTLAYSYLQVHYCTYSSHSLLDGSLGSSFASACMRSLDHSLFNSQPASAKSHVPCSQACKMQSIVSDLPWLLTTNPCWRHARDAFLQRHASPSSQSTSFENKSTVRAMERHPMCRRRELEQLCYPGLPWFSDSHALFWRACDSIL
jgi:hypothetical protein